MNGIRSYGFEIHPFLHWIASTSLTLDIDEQELQQQFSILAENFVKLSAAMPLDPEQLPLRIPQIYNPYRWWRRDVLRDLLVLKMAIRDLQTRSEVANFFLLGLAGVLVPDLTNVTLGRLQLHFIDRSEDSIEAWHSFQSHMNTMISDVEQTRHRPQGQAQVVLIDSTNLQTTSYVHNIDYVITSPPYPNRYSYVWNTRPHLYFFDFFDSAKEASQLDSKIIGGTWGTATSMLQKGRVEPEYDAVAQYILPFSERIRAHDNLMANYIVKYFNGLTRQLLQMGDILSKGAKLAYVVGCSKIKGVYIETDVLLAQIMETLPFGCFSSRSASG